VKRLNASKVRGRTWYHVTRALGRPRRGKRKEKKRDGAFRCMSRKKKARSSSSISYREGKRKTKKLLLSQRMGKKKIYLLPLHRRGRGDQIYRSLSSFAEREGGREGSMRFSLYRPRHGRGPHYLNPVGGKKSLSHSLRGGRIKSYIFISEEGRGEEGHFAAAAATAEREETSSSLPLLPGEKGVHN